jgi:lon-related putative ATP-dependent protease
MLSLVSTVSLEPEPVPIDIKVILIGDRQLYYLLHRLDPDFEKLFKVSVDFEGETERNEETTMQYARLIAGYIKSQKLLPMTQAAVARVIENSSRHIEDSERYSTHIESMSELVAEANYWASEEGITHIDDKHVIRAIDKKKYRSDRVHRKILDEIQRQTILIDTDGEETGQINGLTIIELGGFLFGSPSRITATARLGEGEVVDIEREVELGGAIHSKGVLILSKYISSRYCREKPLSLTASLVMEQSYGMIEGDSASVAECCALLSVLSGLPLKQSLAVTGSVNQLGEVQPIGGVNEKIEGFFEVCKQRGLNGEHAVIIPRSNIKHLMLHDDVIQAVADGKFNIYAISTVDDAMFLLTGMEPGSRDDKGRFPVGTINNLVETRLERMAVMRHEFAEHDKDKGDDKNEESGK